MRIETQKGTVKIHTAENFFVRHSDSVWVLCIFFVWRGVIELIALMGKYHFAYLAKASPWNTFSTQFAGFWARWDSGWYYSIIRGGYEWIDPAKGASNVAFFPLYPYLVKLFSFPLHSNPFAVGAFLSSVFLAIALIIFFALIRLDYSRGVAYRAVFFLLLFPLSFFFTAVYTESLFFLLCVSSLYAARREHWFWAGVLGFGAAFSRLVGVALLIVLAIEYLEQKNWKFSKIRANFGYIWFVPLGLFAYMFILKSQIGNSLQFFNAQAAWHRSLQLPFDAITQTYWPLVVNAAAYADPAKFGKIFDFFYFGLALILILTSFFVLRKSYAVFSLLAFIPSILTGTFESEGRYLLVLFPCFLLLALAGKFKPLEFAYILFGAGLLTYNIILFINWSWVA